MRLAYFDEAGVSNSEDEPDLVVAGVITNPDTDYLKLEARFRTLAEEALGEKGRSHFGSHYIFQAKQIWHGSGDFSRDVWSLPSRMELFGKLCALPAQFDLAIVFGRTEKDVWREWPRGTDRSTKLSKFHAACHFQAMRRVESWMKTNASTEVVALVSERCDKQHMLQIEQVQKVACDRSNGEIKKVDPLAFISDHIVEAPIFLDKYSSPLLQLADICAFTLKRKFQKCPHVSSHFEKLKPAIWFEPDRASQLMAVIHEKNAIRAKPQKIEISKF